jgi:hypothetical protein
MKLCEAMYKEAEKGHGLDGGASASEGPEEDVLNCRSP